MRAVRLTLLAAGLAAGLAAIPAVAAPPADPGPSDAGVSHSERRVCPAPVPGFVACTSHVVTAADGVTPLATVDLSGGYKAQQLQTAYTLPTSSTMTTVAIVDAYAHPNAAADLAVYRDAMNLAPLGPDQFKQIAQDGNAIGTVSANAGWGQEEMLDLEMVSAVCPTCNILYVGAKSASFSDLATAVNRAASTLGVTVISNSYGGNEWSGETSQSIAGAYNHPGIAITVSSGDSGYGVQVPAAFNTVTAVGGTNLKLDSSGGRASETVWSGAGSGCSAYVAKPSWQTDKATCSRRTVADVAAVADPNTGVAVYTTSGSTGGANWYVFGGTSVAAPIIGGVYALSGNFGSTANSTPAGVPASLAYANAGSLFDVKSGSNGRCVKGKSTSTAYLCTGVTGYDGPTGNGAPNGGSLAAF